MKLINKLLNEYEENYGSIKDISIQETQIIKRALWIGYNTGKRDEASWRSATPIRNQEGNVISDRRDEMVQ